MEIRPTNTIMLLLYLPLKEAESSLKHLKILKLWLVERGSAASVIPKAYIEQHGQSRKGRGNTSGRPRQEVAPHLGIGLTRVWSLLPQTVGAAGDSVKAARVLLFPGSKFPDVISVGNGHCV